MWTSTATGRILCTIVCFAPNSSQKIMFSINFCFFSWSKKRQTKQKMCCFQKLLERIIQLNLHMFVFDRQKYLKCQNNSSNTSEFSHNKTLCSLLLLSTLNSSLKRRPKKKPLKLRHIDVTSTTIIKSCCLQQSKCSHGRTFKFKATHEIILVFWEARKWFFYCCVDTLFPEA